MSRCLKKNRFCLLAMFVMFLCFLGYCKQTHATTLQIENYFCSYVDASFSVETEKFTWAPVAYLKGGDGRDCGSKPEVGFLNFYSNESVYRDNFDGQFLCVNFYRTSENAWTNARDRKNMDSCSNSRHNDLYFGTVSVYGSNRTVNRTYGEFRGNDFTFFEMKEYPQYVVDSVTYDTGRITPVDEGDWWKYETTVNYYVMAYYTRDNWDNSDVFVRSETLTYYKPKQNTAGLAATAIDADTRELIYGVPDYKVTVREGQSATVRAPSDVFPQYNAWNNYDTSTFCWLQNQHDDIKKCEYLNSRRVTVDNLRGSRRIYVVYWKKTTSAFSGDSGVMEIPDGNNNVGYDDIPESKRKFVGWHGSGSASANYIVNDCDPTNGCWVSFRHYLKRTSGNGFTQYMIDRDGTGGDTGWTTKGFSGNGGEIVASNPVKMYPGQKFCETMMFRTNGVSSTASTTICAVAVGSMESYIKMEARKNDGDWQSGDIYIKPKDKVDLQASYTPSYQFMYNMVLPGSSTTNGVANNGRSIGKTFDSSEDPDWNNAFSIKIDENTVCNDNFSSNVGNSGEYTGTKFNFDTGGAGSMRKAQAVTNCGNDTRTTPSKVDLSYAGDKFIANVDTGAKSSNEIKIFVPYNYTNTVEIRNVQGGIVYAGEDKLLHYNVNVGTKVNELVTGSSDEKYSTVVRNGKIKYRICDENYSNCYDTSETKSNGDWNPEGILEGWQSSDLSSWVPIPDKPAGTKICIAPSIYPANSGADDNIDPNGNGEWTSIEEGDYRCFTIAKHPSFQVWGGNVTANKIEAPLAAKNKIDRYTGDTPRLFGSWGELAVASGNNDTMASGAAWGYASNGDNGLQPNPSSDEVNNTGDPGGGTSNDKCKYSMLTFGSECGMFEELGGGSGEMNESTIATMAKQIKEKLEKVDNYFYSNISEIRLGEEELVDNRRFYENTGNISILTDIRIDRSNSDNNFSRLDDVPQVVVYAENINIACDVGRIDAILIATNTIDTCAHDDKPNEEDEAKKQLANLGIAQKQLIINGAMYANTIHFDRTYGAGTGTRSIVPAEIVNYDNSMLFTGGGGGTPTGGSMDVVYVRELAPRYKDN